VQELQTTTERVEKDRVKLRVEVPEGALEPAINAAYRKWSNQMSVPGFRKGKVPRRIIDTRVGVEIVRDDALRDALPDLYRRAMAAEDLEAITSPEIDVVAYEPGSPLVFEATVDVRPEVKVPDLESISVQAPSTEVTESDLDEQLERLRDRFSEVETIGREARRGDFVLIDLKGYRGDELIDAAGAPDLLYEVGSHEGPPRLDGELEGTRPGAILRFTDTMPEGAGELAGQDLSFTVLVKEVKTKRLPPLDDDFAKTVGEFDSLDELKDDLRTRLAGVKVSLVEEEIRSLVLDELVRASDLDPPQKLIEQEFEHRLGHLEDDLKRAGLSLAAYAREAQLTELEVRRDIRSGAASSVKAELLLEQVARDQEIEVTEEDLGRELVLAAARTQRDPSELAKQLAADGRLGSVAADIMRRKALDYVVEHVNVGNRPADRESAETGEESGLS